MLTIPQAQRNNAQLYREWARHSPWNSKTRAAWLELAETAERVARYFERDAARTE